MAFWLNLAWWGYVALWGLLLIWVRPGITGWAQINHKYGDTLEDAARKLEYDLYYIKHLSLALDLYILFHTLKTVILSRGAQ